MKALFALSALSVFLALPACVSYDGIGYLEAARSAGTAGVKEMCPLHAEAAGRLADEAGATRAFRGPLGTANAVAVLAREHAEQAITCDEYSDRENRTDELDARAIRAWRSTFSDGAAIVGDK